MARDPAVTRRLVLETAMARLRDLDVTDLITAIGTREIARRAGVSPATVFHHFGSVEGLASAILAGVYDPDGLPVAVINAKVGTVRAAERPSTAGIEMHRSEFDRLQQDPAHRLRIGLWAFGGDRARATYGDYLRVTDAQFVDQTRALLASWGREPRPPFTIETFVGAHTALLTGSVIRHASDSTSVDSDHFAMAALALTFVMLRSPGDTHSIEDRLAEINQFPVREPAGRSPSEQRLQTRRRVLDAAGVVFARVGYERATIADIAKEAFVAPTTIYGLVEGKAALAISLLHDQLATMGEPADELDAGLLQVAELLAARADLVAPYAARLATSAASDPLVDRIATLVASLRDDEDPQAVAHSLVLLLVSRILAAPATGAAGAVAHVRLILGP